MPETVLKLILLYMLVMSLITFFAMGLDKLKAKRDKRRIPEKTLFLLALSGGAAGGLAGIYVFRHKTRHASFRFGMPLLLILNCAAAYGIYYAIYHFTA